MDIQPKSKEVKKADEEKLIKTHFPREALPMGKQGQTQFGVAVILHVNYDHVNVMPLLLRSRDSNCVASFVTTALCLRWLYDSKRPVYKISPDGKMEKVEDTNGLKVLKGMCSEAPN